MLFGSHTSCYYGIEADKFLHGEIGSSFTELNKSEASTIF